VARVKAAAERVEAPESQLLFLDTNVFLSFFHFAKDDLDALRRVAVLVKRDRVTLLLPDQVVREFHRNRDGKVADALKQVENSKLPAEYPRFCQDLPEYHQLRAQRDEYETTRKALLENVRAAAEGRKLAADKVTEELFKAATAIEITPEIFARADHRYRRGDPPGKQDRRESIGDALNWESLLSIEEEGDLYFVAEDLDWASALNTSTFNSVLQNEWKGSKKATVHFYQRLSAFLGEFYPDIKLASELEKDVLIDELAFTRNFAQTHRTIAALRAPSDFTKPQLNAIVTGYVTNDQIWRIIDDADVRDFLTLVIASRLSDVEPELAGQLLDTINRCATADSPLQSLTPELALAAASLAF
jgi:hypothetical protein